MQGTYMHIQSQNCRKAVTVYVDLPQSLYTEGKDEGFTEVLLAQQSHWQGGV